MSSLSALLGRIFSRGTELELQGGLNFASPLRATPNNDPNNPRIDVELDESFELPEGAAGVREVAFVTTSNDTLSGLAARDGYTPAAGELALATAQNTTANNGLWLTASGAWTRPEFFDANDDVVPGTQWQVENGTLGAATTWRLKSGNTIAGAKVVERIDATPLYLDATRPPYNVLNSSTGVVNSNGIELAISDADALGGREIRLPPAFSVNRPIFINGRTNVVLAGPDGMCTITPGAHFGGPMIYMGGYGIGTFLGGAALGSSDTFALNINRTGLDEHWVDITLSGIDITPTDPSPITAFGIRFQCAFTSISTAAGVLISCQGNRSTGDTFTRLFKISTTTTGSIVFILRLRDATTGVETEYTLTTATGTVVADDTKYQIEGNYDGTTIRLFVTKMEAGQTSCDPAQNGADAIAGVRGYAEQAVSGGEIEQYPWEHTHYGVSHQGEYPSGAVLQATPTGRLGRVVLSAAARNVAQHTPGVASPNFTAGGSTKDFYSLDLTASSSHADGELLKNRYSYADGISASSANGYSFVRGGDAGAANDGCGVRNIKVNTSGGFSYALTGFYAANSPQCFVENFECTAGFQGIILDNNSYNFRLRNLFLGGGHISLGCFVGLVDYSGSNRIHGNARTICLAVRGSGTFAGTTYMAPIPSAYIGISLQCGHSEFSGFSLTDENAADPFFDCALYLASASGNHDIDFKGNIELFSDGGQLIRVRAATNRVGTTLRFKGRFINIDHPERPIVLFDGDPDNVSEVIFDGCVFPSTYRVTNCPGKVRQSRPAASIVLEEQTGSIAEVPIFQGESLVAQLATTADVALTGEQTIDDVLTSTSVVLVKENTDESENGLYTTAAGAWTRHTSLDTSGEVVPFFRVRVTEGTVSANKTYHLTTVEPPGGYVLGTTDLAFADATDIPVAGLWVVSVVLQCTVADAGAGTVKVGIHGGDAAGAFTVETSELDLTTEGRLPATSFQLDLDGVTNLTYSTTVDTPGTAEYRVRITADKVPA
jgi:hypothetical protein